MTKDPNFVSVRLPDDVAIWLREYATANKLVRADKPNMGGSIIAIVRAAMQGQTISNNVGQSSDNTDIKKELDSLRSLVVSFDWRIEEQQRMIAPLVARLEAVENIRSEAIATAKKPLTLSPQMKVVAMQKLQATA